MTDDIRAMYDSELLGAWDLEGRDQIVTIERVEAGELTASGNKKSRKPVMYFRGKKKGVVVNKTNLKTIANIVGSFRAKDWIGKRITIYPTKTMFGGEEKDCIRVRPSAPGRGAAEAPPDPPPADNAPEPGSNG